MTITENPGRGRRPSMSFGYAYPDHSEQPHYHLGHPRKKTQSMTKVSGPYDGDDRYANTGVPPTRLAHPPHPSPEAGKEVVLRK